MRIRIVDTFAGIGGLRLGAEAAAKELGIKISCVKTVENNKEACKTYNDNFRDGHIEPEDIKKIPASKYPEHDLLLGGFPCQAFSRNGRIYNFAKKEGCKTLDQDERTPLFQYLHTILNVKKPSFFVFENVKEIKTIKNGDGTLFFDGLMECLGKHYNVACSILDSRDFGLPQQRRRVYFVGSRKGLGLNYQFPEGDKAGKPSVAQILDKAVADKYLLENLWKTRSLPSDKKRTLKDVIEKIASIASFRKKEKSTSGWEFANSWEQDDDNNNAQPNAQPNNPNFAQLLLKALQHRSGECIPRIEALKCIEQAGPSYPTGVIEPVAIIYGDTPSGLPRQQDKLYSIMGTSPTIATFSTPCFNVNGARRMLTPRECARLQGFPDDFKLPEKDALAYRQIGNAVSVNVAKAVVKALLLQIKGSSRGIS